jgi:hypothetical protein
VALGVLLISRASTTLAAVVASDVASSAAYGPEAGGAWKGLNPVAEENPPGSDDGGSGLKPWNFAGGAHYSQKSPYGRLNHFIDGVDFTASSFNNLGAPAFALTNANEPRGGATSIAARPLDSPLSVGPTLSLKFDNPALAPLASNDEAGFVIRLNEGGGPLGQTGVSERFAIFASSNFLNGNWAAGDAAGDNSLGVSTNTTTSGAEFRFTLTGAESYRLDLLPLAGGTPLATRTGNLAHPGTGAIDTIEILMYGNGSGNGLTGGAAQRTGEREFYFNNLSIATPGLAGDYDGDGDVDGGDLLRWQRNLGSTTNLAADGNNDGRVDAADLQVWKSAFPRPSGGGAISLAIPEPRALELLGAWLSLAAARLRLRRNVA